MMAERKEYSDLIEDIRRIVDSESVPTVEGGIVKIKTEAETVYGHEWLYSKTTWTTFDKTESEPLYETISLGNTKDDAAFYSMDRCKTLKIQKKVKTDWLDATEYEAFISITIGIKGCDNELSEYLVQSITNTVVRFMGGMSGKYIITNPQKNSRA